MPGRLKQARDAAGRLSSGYVKRRGSLSIEQAALLADVNDCPRTVYQHLRMRAMAAHPPDLVTPLQQLREAIETQSRRALEQYQSTQPRPTE